MASSFHWTNMKKALKEFDRILVSNGIFSAIWNPRLTKKSHIEKRLKIFLIKKYQIESRVSSGLNGINNNLRGYYLKVKSFVL